MKAFALAEKITFQLAPECLMMHNVYIAIIILWFIQFIFMEYCNVVLTTAPLILIKYSGTLLYFYATLINRECN